MSVPASGTPAGSPPGSRSAARRESRRSRGRPSARLGDHHLRGPQLVLSISVTGPYDVDHGAGPRVRIGPDGHSVVPGRVERRAEVVTTREAQTGQHGERLIPDRPDSLDDG